MRIDASCRLDEFRRFMIVSTCASFMPFEFGEDLSIFPERAKEQGTMYVEAEDKETLGRSGEIAFTRASRVLGIIYNSKSGRTQLKWRHLKGDWGRISGEASPNSIVHLYEAGVLNKRFLGRYRPRTERPPERVRESPLYEVGG